jgi:2-aminoethylphosphonate aminotransferase
MQREESISKRVRRAVLLNPGPATTSVRVKAALIATDVCPREAEFGEVLREVRRDAADIIGGGSDYTSILLTSSGTGAMEAALTSAVGAGETVLILENGAYGKRMKDICLAFGIDFTAIDAEWGKPIDLFAVRALLKNPPKKIAALAFIHHETTVGILNPLSELIEIARSHSLISIVDAMSSYAGIPIDLRETPVDFLLSSANKCIQGMAGIAIVVARKSSLDALKEKTSRSFYFSLYKNYEAQENTGQSLFTPPAQILYALHEAFKEIKAEGPSNRYARYRELYELMYAGMRALGFEPLVEEAFHSGILTAFLEPRGFDFTAYHDFLFERGITVYPGKIKGQQTFRISNIGDLGLADIDYFLDSTREYLQSTRA